MNDGPLTIEQIASIIRGACTISPTASVDEDEAERIVQWCSHALIDYATVLLVTQGDVGMSWHPDSPEPTFTSIRPFDVDEVDHG